MDDLKGKVAIVTGAGGRRGIGKAIATRLAQEGVKVVVSDVVEIPYLDGDWKADTKILLDSTYASNGIPEHSDNGFVRNLDNWYYSAKSRLRYKFQKGFWIRDSTEFRGQWGISQDDQGRLVYNYNWSQLHADLVAPNSITAWLWSPGCSWFNRYWAKGRSFRWAVAPSQNSSP